MKAANTTAKREVLFAQANLIRAKMMLQSLTTTDVEGYTDG